MTPHPLSLWRKELREARPWGVLSLVLGLTDVVDELFKQTDLRPLAATFKSVFNGGAITFFGLAFAVGLGLAVRERDDGTLGFLDGLPVRRSAVFFTKLAASAAMVLLAPLLSFSAAIALHLLSRGSLDHPLHLGLLAEAAGLELVLVLEGLLLGAALGTLRSLAWLGAGVLAIGLAVLEKQEPRAGVLSPFTLTEATVSGGATLEPGAGVLPTHLAITALAGLVAWRAFVAGSGARLVTLSRRPVVGAIIAVLTVISLGTALVLLTKDRDPEASSTKHSVRPEFAEGPPATTSTVHYRFSYPSSHSAQVLELASHADAVFEKVHALLHTPLTDRVDVDLSGSVRNTAGTAFFGGVRMTLSDASERVLAHETTHVIAQRLAGGEKDHLWKQALILNEGLATWAERHFSGERQSEADARLVLAALQEREQLPAAALADLEQLSERDELLKYPVGAAIIDTLVQRAGEEAIPRLLAAFADERLPPKLSGLELWRVVFQNAGLDLGGVLDAFYAGLAREAKERAAVLEALPRPRTQLVSRGDHLGARALLDRALDEGWGLTLRFEPAEDSPSSRYDRSTVSPLEIVWRDPSQIRAGKVCVQAGLKTPSGATLFEPWSCLRAEDAAPLPAWDDALRARLEAFDAGPFERLSQVVHPHPGVFGDEAASAWPPLDALSARWRALPDAQACFDALLAGLPDGGLSAGCGDALEAAREPTRQVAHATEAAQAGLLGELGWLACTRPDGGLPLGPRMAERTLLWEGDEALREGGIVPAEDRCVAGLALARDVGWGASASTAEVATALSAVILPVCLRAAMRAPVDELEPFAERVRRVRAGLPPLRHVIENHRLASGARLFAPVLDDEVPAPFEDFVDAWSDEGPERDEADELWPQAEAYFERALAAEHRPLRDRLARAGFPPRLARRSSLNLEWFFRERECHLGLLAMIERTLALRAGTDGGLAEALTLEPRDGGSTKLEVSCGVTEPAYRAELTDGGVRWTVILPPDGK